MTQTLPSDQLNLLLPILSHLAELVQKKGRLAREDLQLLLLASGLDEDWALDELERWVKVLLAIRGVSDPYKRELVQRALMLRNVPEASATLAVSTAAGSTPDQGSEQAGRRLTSSVASLDLGTLPANAPAAGEFQVEGGPGRIVVESEQVQVMPLQFGPQTTTVRVQIKALASGFLWTTLKLITAGETLEVPVLAQWQAATQPPMDTITPSDWVVAPDGSGDYRSLSEAVEKAEAGATLRLKAGVHRLNRPLEINKELSLIGEGMETTRIACAEAGTVVRYTGEGTFSASDLTFVHEGLNWGGAFSADRGEVFLQRCRFTGGIRDKTNSRGGDGLWLHGNVRGQVISCHAVENELIGIRVSEQAQPILEGNTCQGNKDTGIAYFGTAAGVARRNTCTGNESRGIYVGGQAQPTLEGNTCQGNKQSGISYFGTAAGVARQNTCTGNENRGISVGEQAQPTLEGNTCQGNKWSGIAYFGTAAGVARQNTCTGNEQYGIYVGEQAQPTLEGNTCQENKWSGIAYFGTAAGVARRNTCTGNEKNGIYVASTASPTLVDNRCLNNTGSNLNDQRR